MIEAIMHRTILDVTEDTLVQDVIDGLKTNKIGAFLVKNDDGYTGIITREDIIQKVIGKQDPKSIKAVDIMSSPIDPVDISTSIGEACIIVCERMRRRLVVSQDGKIVGILNVNDLVPGDLMNISLTSEELFNRVGLYGDELLEKEKSA